MRRLWRRLATGFDYLALDPSLRLARMRRENRRRHWICRRCPAGYYCAWMYLPIEEPGRPGHPGHRHDWAERP